MQQSDNPTKVLLWSTPRSMSTIFLKSMTFVPDTIAWFEPFLQIGRFGREKLHPQAKLTAKMVEMMGRKAAVEAVEGGFDANDTTYEWLKDQLEGNYSDKKHVFVKEISSSIVDKWELIPDGFKHTFLIRHPAKIAASSVKVMAKHSTVRGSKGNASEQEIKEVYGLTTVVKDSYDLLQHIKENYEPNPIIIDADDFLEDPPRMLEAYCKGVGIPYSPGLLTWEAGDEVMTKRWMVPKETILIRDLFGAHESSFRSTRFQKQEKQAPPSLSEIPPALLPLLESQMPYYEKLYAKRLTC